MSKFTVILLYPDYATGDYGADVYIRWTEAEDYEEAVKQVQRMAEEANSDGHGAFIAAADFRPVLVLEGECRVVADATCFD